MQRGKKQVRIEMVLKIPEIHPKKVMETIRWEGFMEKVSFECGVEDRSDA